VSLKRRSVVIDGHRTSVSIEPEFWDALTEVAKGQGRSVNALIAEIDALRIESRPAPNLTSALRQWLFAQGLHGRE
jgi:predicted DNA-binding ribbon-helix-helix protein